MMRTIVLLAAILSIAAAPANAVEIKRPLDIGFYRLKSLSFVDAKAVASPFMSPRGKLTYAKGQRLLVIHDFPEKIQAVKKILAEVDTEPVNIRVDVRFEERRTREREGLGIDRGGIRVGRRRGRTRIDGSIRISGGNARSTSTLTSTQFVLTRNGAPARIWVGEKVADPVWIFEYGHGRGWWRRDWEWQELGASLWVRPLLLSSGQIQIELHPKLSFRGERNLAVDVREMATMVMASDGQEVRLAGLDQKKRDFYRHLLGRSRVFDGQELSIALTPHVQKPRRKRGDE